MVGELVADGETEAKRRAIRADQVQPNQFRFLARVEREVGRIQRRTRMHDNRAVALVEPFRLHARLSGRGRAAFNTPLEHAHGISQRSLLGLLTQLLMHGIAGRCTAKMREAGSGDQAVRRIRMMQR